MSTYGYGVKRHLLNVSIWKENIQPIIFFINPDFIQDPIII